MNREDLIALADEPVIGGDGRVRPPTERERVARVVLYAIKNPEGIETIDWEIADAVLALRSQASSASTTEAKPMTESEGKLLRIGNELAAVINIVAAMGSQAANVKDRLWGILEDVRSIRTPAQPASGGVDLHWLVDWVHIYTTEGHSWIGAPEADRLIALAARKPTQADAERFKSGAALKSFELPAPSPASEAGREPMDRNAKAMVLLDRWQRGWSPIQIIDALFPPSPLHPANQVDEPK